mgnify:CR=1 FL=1|jgi:hypothetical protein
MSDQKKFIALMAMVSLSCVLSAASLMASVNNGAYLIFGDDVKNGTLQMQDVKQPEKTETVD